MQQLVRLHGEMPPVAFLCLVHLPALFKGKVTLAISAALLFRVALACLVLRSVAPGDFLLPGLLGLGKVALMFHAGEFAHQTSALCSFASFVRAD
ncbi:MAG: hypothetical protein K1X78_21870 [Verrucomicrobiaceae bacterium]|nr:hypothetical protein [Verrucomicrobiaceae bacterium]